MSQLVSVVIPTYKRPTDLIRAIKSVLNQSYSFFEILVVNDDDNEVITIELIKNFKDKRIKYFRNSRTKGGNGARNTGILNAKGHFIAFLDDDDEWYTENLENKVLNCNNQNLNCGGIFNSYMLEEGSNWVKTSYNIDELSLKDAILDNYSIGSSSNLMIKKTVFDNIGLWDEDLLRQQDLELLIRILSKYRVIYDRKTTIKVYGHNTPAPMKAFTEREKYLEKIKKFVNILDNNDQINFYSSHYRRQVVFLLMQNKKKLAIKNWNKAIGYKLFSFRKDVKIIFSYIKSILN